MRWTDHKTVGLQYALTALCFLLVGFLLMLADAVAAGVADLAAAASRWRPPSARANAPGGYMLPEFYNQLVAMHGTVMIFLAVVPLLTGAFGNYLVPLQIGAPDMAFPRLNAASYWIYLAGGLLMLASFFVAGRRGQFGLDVVSAARRLRDARAGPLARRHLPARPVVDAERDQRDRDHRPAARAGPHVHAPALLRLVAADRRAAAAARVSRRCRPRRSFS